MDRQDLPRLPDWVSRLSAHVEQCHQEPFEDGVSDCLKLVLGGIDAMTGSSLYAPYAGTYKNQFGALRKLKREGFDRLDDFMRSGFRVIPVSQMVTGDVAVGVDAQKGQHLCMMMGLKLETKMPQGRVSILPGRIVEAYRVG